MMSLLKFISNTKLKHPKTNQEIGGFTMIELLVAMVIAFLVITPVLAFMMNILDSDRKEQVKATTEQEIQAALDYIARDLQQAVYIYDADGVNNTHNTNVTLSGIKDQIPPIKSAPNCSPTSASNSNVCTPVLVFWKREFVPNSVGVSSATDTVKNDGYAYSLVAYYLITNPNNSDSTWSQEARIGRFQIRGKVNIANANSTGTASDTGFNPPPLSSTTAGASLKEKMNQWQTSLATSANYTQRVETLVDYISTSGPGVTCSSGQGIGTNTTGFYTCVDYKEVLAQVYLRGNALARIQNTNFSYVNTRKTYFPAASMRVQGRGFLFTK